MKIRHPISIDFASVDSAYALTLHSFVKLFQEASIHHSSRIDADSKPSVSKDMIWVLYQYGIEIDDYPGFGDEIEIVTWIRKIDGFKIYRETEAYSGTAKIASASAVYILYDKKNKKIIKIPEKSAAEYPVSRQKAYAENLDLWRPVSKFTPEFETEMITRISDYDPLGHVNNSSYFDFVETMLFRYFNKEVKIKTIKITYVREMNKTVTRFKSALLIDGNIWRFKIGDENTLFSYGELTV